MLDAHEQMFGDAGRHCAELVIKWAAILFAVPLETLNIRVVLAPVEMGPYNKHAGYIYGGEGKAAFILGNRHIVSLYNGTLVLVPKGRWFSEDFIVHELIHARQAQLLDQHRGEKEWKISRPGAHRNRAWYAAVSEACPRYLGFELPASLWPTGPRTRKGTLSEVEMTHWPQSIRMLAEIDRDPRLTHGTAVRIANGAEADA
jgi:hypothetical protein